MPVKKIAMEKLHCGNIKTVVSLESKSDVLIESKALAKSSWVNIVSSPASCDENMVSTTSRRAVLVLCCFLKPDCT
jgi:hypothetical protein